MPQDELTLRMDSELRQSAEEFFRSYGFTMSTGINAVLKDVIEQGKMPIRREQTGIHIYNPIKAEQWVAEDPLFCIETYRDNPYFDIVQQADLRRARAAVQAGNFVARMPNA
jgi:addiction module RelB/DinJ family antitoxin